MFFVFGKTLVCRNLDIAVKLARTSKLDCITLDGEKGSSRGVLSGGYLSLERSKMANYERYQAVVGKLGEVVAELEFKKDELEKAEKKTVSLTNQSEKLQSGLAGCEGSLSSLKADIKSLEESCQYLRSKCTASELSLADMNTDERLMEARMDGLRKEMENDMNSQLTIEDKEKVESAVKKIEKLNSSFKKWSKSRDDLEGVKMGQETKLQELRKDLEDLQEDLDMFGRKEESLQNNKNELDVISSHLPVMMEGFDALVAQETTVHLELNRKKEMLEKVEKELNKLKSMMENVSGRKEKLFEKKVNLQSAVKKLVTKVASLGGVQPEVLDKYKNISRTHLGKELQKVNKKLKKFDNVNKKALDQFITFTEENERLVDRLDQLREDKARILNLVNVLDDKRSEQILYTYKQLFKNFKQVFSRIVPGGSGELILTGSVMEGMTEAERMENAAGLSVGVTFTGDGVMKNLEQLSGGQKSVVALAFILAIQQCDPAPFYLFDEVDAALDVEHRRAIAAVIHSQASEAQFITTTFRPEMLRSADMCWGVVFRGKASQVQLVTNQEASAFVQESKIQN